MILLDAGDTDADRSSSELPLSSHQLKTNPIETDTIVGTVEGYSCSRPDAKSKDRSNSAASNINSPPI